MQEMVTSLAFAESSAIGMSRLIVPLALALLTLLASLGAFELARRLLRPLDHSATPLAERLVLGWPLFGLLVYIAGCFSASRMLLGVVLGCCALSGIPALRGLRPGRPRLFGLLRIVGVFAAPFLFAQAPASTLDELAYHLAAPRMWLSAGRIIELPLLSHSYFPFALESVSLPALALLGSRGAISAHFVHLLMAVAGVMAISRRVDTHRWTVTAAIVTTPALLITAGWAWVDFELTILGALLFLSLRDESKGKSSALTNALALAGGLLTKYTFAPLALVLVTIALLTSSERRRLLQATLAGGAIGIFFYVRNLLWTGNPFAPLFSSEGGGAFGYRSSGTVVGQIGTYLFDVRFVDEALGLTLAILLIGGCVAARRLGRFDRLSLVSMTLLTIILLAVAPSSRLLLPYLVVVAISGSVAMQSSLLRTLVAIAAAVQLAIVGLYTASQGLVPLLTGDVSEHAYLLQHRRSYAATRWIDGVLPPQSRTLVVGSLELFWFEHDVRGGGNFDGTRVARYLDLPDDALWSRLSADGITHIAVLQSGVRVGRASSDIKVRERETVLTPEQARRFRDFLRRQTRVAAGGDAVVVQVSSD